MSGQVIKSSRPILKEVRTVLSNNREEAKRRVLSLYKLWYRQAPYVGEIYEITFMTYRVFTYKFSCFSNSLGL